MSLWRQMTRGLRVLADRPAADRDLADEVRHYLEEATEEGMANGRSAEEARRAARIEIGNLAAVRDELRAGGWEHAVDTLAADLRYAVRQLRANPGFAATAVLVLGLGIGATTAIFSVVNPILFQPLPYPGAQRLTMIWERRGEGGRMASFGTYRALAERSRSFDALAAVKTWQPTRTGPAEPERLQGQRVTAAYFRTLGVRPAIGRDFREADDAFHGPNVTIISDALWRRQFGADPAIVGRQVILDDNGFTVIGVMPRGFENVLAPDAEIWAPLQYNPSLPPDGREWGHHLRLVARLRPGWTRDAARNELNGAAPVLARVSRQGYANSGGPPDGFIVNLLQADVVADVQPALLVVAGAVALVLLIACVNVTNLLLARGARRRSEFAMRAALGAPRGRLLRQQITETGLVAALGGAVGLTAAIAGVRGLVALAPPDLPRTAAIGVDAFVFIFTVCLTSVIGLAVGLVPALHGSRVDLQAGIQPRSRGGAGGHQQIRRALVVAEVAVSLVLLVGAGLLLRSLERLFAVRSGFDPSGVLTLQVQESGHRFDGAGGTEHFFEQALEAVRQVPGVAAAGFTSQLPLSGDLDSYGVQFQHDAEQDGPAFRYAVSPGYFAAMRIPLRRGRLLNEHDTAGAPTAVVLSESLARRVFRDGDPIGEHVRVGPDIARPERPWATIVGVVGNVKQASLAINEDDAFYVTTSQWPFPDAARSLVVRSSGGNAAALAPAVKRAVWSVDKDQPIVRVATMEHVLAASEARRRFALLLFEAFAAAALVLAATGVYGVLSGTVVERRREIGVRAALGASRREVVVLILRGGMTLTGLGVLIGLGGSAIASRTLVTLLFGISPLDPITYVAVIALLAGVSAIACWLPASRAARVDPSVTLRAE